MTTRPLGQDDTPGTDHPRPDGDAPGRCNLVMVVNPNVCDGTDFHRIGGYVLEMAPDLHPIVLTDRPHHCLRPRLLFRPTFVFSPARLRFFRPLRGAVFQGQHLTKSRQCEAMQRHGIPVPKWASLTRDFMPDLDGFGKYVVTKPDRGGRGADVKIRRRGRVRWKPPEAAMAGRCRDVLVQEFIYTGPWPISYRVATLFGKALYAHRAEADHRRLPLSGPEGFAGGGPDDGGISIVSSAMGCTMQLCYERDIIELGERTHAAFPNVPLLGVDIIREHAMGKLYVIEVNPGGYTWHFSSPRGRIIQETFGFDYESQFDGIQRAATILVDQARRHAR